MPELADPDRAFGALAVALLLIGARSIRAEGVDGSAAGEPVGGGFRERFGQRRRGRPRGRRGAAGRLPAAGRGKGHRRGRARRGPGSERRCSTRSTWPRGWRTGSRWSSRRRARRARSPPPRAAADGPISLGTATVEQLDTIEGIGPVTAQQIVEFRDRHGGLSSVDQLDQISGIGPATMDALRDAYSPDRRDRGRGWRLARSAGAARPRALAAARPGRSRSPATALAASVLAIALLARPGAAVGSPAVLWSRCGAAWSGCRSGPRGCARSTPAPSPDARASGHRRGHVIAVPRRTEGEVRVRAPDRGGKLLAVAPEPVPDMAIGAEVRASGRPAPGRPPGGRPTLRRQGIAMILRPSGSSPPAGAAEGSRARSTRSATAPRPRSARACPKREAALARGFVLGQDDRIDPATVDDFRRSGLAICSRSRART